MKSPATSLLLVMGLLLVPLSAMAYSSGPPNGRTNAPGETNCTACHSTFPLNSGSGSLVVTDLGSWEPGQTYDLTVTLADPDASRWGFEFTVLDQGGSRAGTLASLDANTQVSSTASRDYAKQTSAGSQPGTPDQASWTVRWTAPDAGSGDLTLYMAANAANGNSAASGDRIYAINSTWSEGTTSPAPMPALAGADLKANYPNPFNPRTTLAFELASDQQVALNIYSLDGRLVRELISGTRSAGRHEVAWDGLDRSGRAVPSGTYLYRLQAGGQVQTRTMALVR
jgi:hypothetical protein